MKKVFILILVAIFLIINVSLLTLTANADQPGQCWHCMFYPEIPGFTCEMIESGQLHCEQQSQWHCNDYGGACSIS